MLQVLQHKMLRVLQHKMIRALQHKMFWMLRRHKKCLMHKRHQGKYQMSFRRHKMQSR